MAYRQIEIKFSGEVSTVWFAISSPIVEEKTVLDKYLEFWQRKILPSTALRAAPITQDVVELRRRNGCLPIEG